MVYSIGYLSWIKILLLKCDDKLFHIKNVGAMVRNLSFKLKVMRRLGLSA
jgi:hypothetical protein